MKAREIDELKKGMIRASHAAGDVLRKYFRKPIRVSEKPDAGLVTNADLEAEEVSLKILRKLRPDFELLTEESTPEGTKGGGIGRWIIDPLDGTTNFVHRFPMFCVSLAAEWKGKIAIGVIHHPILDETYVALRGKGAYLGKTKLHVSGTRDLRASLLTTGFSYRKSEELHAEMAPFEELSGIARAIRRPGSAALDLAYTARGVFDAFWERRLSPWDVAAGGLLVEEAGGKVTDFSGNPFSPYSREILASNSRLHKPMLNVIGKPR